MEFADVLGGEEERVVELVFVDKKRRWQGEIGVQSAGSDGGVEVADWKFEFGNWMQSCGSLEVGLENKGRGCCRKRMMARWERK